jgi:tetratricopeptide repeat protein 30
LVIGTLYCSKENFDFGISLIIRSLEPIKEKLGTDTWYYTKRCLLALIEKVIKRQFTINEQFYEKIVSFLDDAYKVGKNITTLIFVDKSEKQKSTVAYEAKFFKKVFAKLRTHMEPKGDESSLKGDNSFKKLV